MPLVALIILVPFQTKTALLRRVMKMSSYPLLKMPLAVLIILTPFQMKTDVTTSSYKGFRLSVIKDAPRCADQFYTVSNENGRNYVEL